MKCSFLCLSACVPAHQLSTRPDGIDLCSVSHFDWTISSSNQSRTYSWLIFLLSFSPSLSHARQNRWDFFLSLIWFDRRRGEHLQCLQRTFLLQWHIEHVHVKSYQWIPCPHHVQDFSIDMEFGTMVRLNIRIRWK